MVPLVDGTGHRIEGRVNAGITFYVHHKVRSQLDALIASNVFGFIRVNGGHLAYHYLSLS